MQNEVEGSWKESSESQDVKVMCYAHLYTSHTFMPFGITYLLEWRLPRSMIHHHDPEPMAQTDRAGSGSAGSGKGNLPLWVHCMAAAGLCI